MPQTDIIARIREGDRETFNAFCRERYASLIAFARLFLSRINGTWADYRTSCSVCGRTVRPFMTTVPPCRPTCCVRSITAA